MYRGECCIVLQLLINPMFVCMVQANNEVNKEDSAGEEPWVLDFPLPDKPESINHGSTDGFNFGGSLGFVYEAMGVHSSVICGKKQVEDVGRDEMVSWTACVCKHLQCLDYVQVPYAQFISTLHCTKRQATRKSHHCHLFAICAHASRHSLFYMLQQAAASSLTGNAGQRTQQIWL